MIKIQKAFYYFLPVLAIFLWACNSTRSNVPLSPSNEPSTVAFTESAGEGVVATENWIEAQNALTQADLPAATHLPTFTHLPTLTPIPNSTPLGVGAFIDVSKDILGPKYEILNAYYFDIPESGERYEIYAGALAGFSDVDTAQGVAVVRVTRVTERNSQPAIEVVATNEFLTINQEYDVFPAGPVQIDRETIPETERNPFLLVSISQGFSWIFLPTEPYMLINSVPPRAMLESGEQKQQAGLGGYCWLRSCADGGISTSAVPILAETSFRARLHLPLMEPPDKLFLSTMWISPPGEPVYDELHQDEEKAVWYIARPVRDLGELSLQREQDLMLSLESGFNVVIVNAVWSEYGDASYGFFIEVRE